MPFQTFAHALAIYKFPPSACRRLPHIVLPSLAFYLRPPSLHRFSLHPTFLPISRGSISSPPFSMPCFGFAILHVGAASLSAALRGVAAPSDAARSLGRRGAILSASHDEGAVLSSGTARCKGRCRTMRAPCHCSAGKRQYHVVVRGCWRRMPVGPRSRSWWVSSWVRRMPVGPRPRSWWVVVCVACP